MKLPYVKHIYGPYAHNLNHVLLDMEGHYISGYGDGTSIAESAEIYVLPEGRIAAQSFLESEPEASARLQQVSDLIFGYETPYGMELSATVHWVGTKEANPAQDSASAALLIEDWNDRKRKLFKHQHIRKAWQHLVEQNWLVGK